jgi:hypothetical protein
MPLPHSKWELVGLGFEFGFVIAVPLLLFINFGKYLDERWQTAPLLTLGGAILAMVFTSVWLYQKIKNYL